MEADAASFHLEQNSCRGDKDHQNQALEVIRIMTSKEKSFGSWLCAWDVYRRPRIPLWTLGDETAGVPERINLWVNDSTCDTGRVSSASAPIGKRGLTEFGSPGR